MVRMADLLALMAGLAVGKCPTDASPREFFPSSPVRPADPHPRRLPAPELGS